MCAIVLKKKTSATKKSCELRNKKQELYWRTYLHVNLPRHLKIQQIIELQKRAI